MPYFDVETVMFEIENVHYKQQITLSNRKMIDTCETLICYVDENSYKSGAKTAMNYAKRQGKKVINLFREEGSPLYGKTYEEFAREFDEQFDKIMKKR